MTLQAQDYGGDTMRATLPGTGPGLNGKLALGGAVLNVNRHADGIMAPPRMEAWLDNLALTEPEARLLYLRKLGGFTVRWSATPLTRDVTYFADNLCLTESELRKILEGADPVTVLFGPLIITPKDE